MEEIKITSPEQAVKLDMVGYLQKLGFTPWKIRRDEYIYYSPFRAENKPSFSVNGYKNVWYDFGLPGGGTIVDFATRYHGCSVEQWIASLQQGIILPEDIHHPDMHPPEKDPEFVIQKIEIIREPSLLQMLSERFVPLYIADHYCRQLTYTLDGITHFGMGMQNDEGGWEIRSPNYKGCIIPKMITTIDNKKSTVVAVEGLFELLSYHALYSPRSFRSENYCLLNGIAWFERARIDFLDKHQFVDLYFNNDQGGDFTTNYAVSFGNRYRDMRHLFSGYNDLNEKLCAVAQQKKLPRLRI